MGELDEDQVSGHGLSELPDPFNRLLDEETTQTMVMWRKPMISSRLRFGKRGTYSSRNCKECVLMSDVNAWSWLMFVNAAGPAVNLHLILIL